MQRIVAGFAELLVGTHHDHRVVVLHRDLEVAKAVLFEQAGFPQGGLDQCLGGGSPVFGQQPGVQGPGIHPDAQRDTGGAGGLGDLSHLVVEGPDVARIHAHRRAAGVNGSEDILRLEVDVGDHRDLTLGSDRGERVGIVLAGDGDAHDVTAGRSEFGDLLQGGVDIGGLGGGHRLHRYRCVASDQNRSHPDLTSGSPRCQHRRRDRGHAQVHRQRFLVFSARDVSTASPDSLPSRSGGAGRLRTIAPERSHRR